MTANRTGTTDLIESSADSTGPDRRRRGGGVLAGTAAYALWGLLTLYWPLLEPAQPLEILAHRIVWSLALVLVVLAVRRDWQWLRTLGRDLRRLGLLLAAGCFVGVNWGLYIWAINSGHVIETALGYYINPLFSAMLGLLVVRERLTPAQWVAIGLSAAGVLWLAIDSQRPPWIALGLAATFACYGLARKKADMPTWQGLAVETALLTVPAVGYLIVLAATGEGHFGGDTVDSLLLVSTGLATAAPLLLFGFATVRTPLTVMGMLQYLLPTIQFLIGLFGLHETITPAGLGAYCLVWAGAIIFLVAYGAANRRADRALENM
ncbi:EamA family transporter RarD [Micromonospora sonneratiae]|uniref:EamA family transporter RarD n=1 Tax=Micromonospora sonneratiae TaxID=1184706 RepID=A0ABW3YIR7_9ACTN